MGLYGSPYEYVIHAGIIATLHVPLITSFQPLNEAELARLSHRGKGLMKGQRYSGSNLVMCSKCQNSALGLPRYIALILLLMLFYRVTLMPPLLVGETSAGSPNSL